MLISVLPFLLCPSKPCSRSPGRHGETLKLITFFFLLFHRIFVQSVSHLLSILFAMYEFCRLPVFFVFANIRPNFVNIFYVPTSHSRLDVCNEIQILYSLLKCLLSSPYFVLSRPTLCHSSSSILLHRVKTQSGGGSSNFFFPGFKVRFPVEHKDWGFPTTTVFENKQQIFVIFDGI
jgi:hypothetical protein